MGAPLLPTRTMLEAYVAAGAFLLAYSRGLPYRYFGHAIGVLSGRYDDREGPGQLTHLEALCAALSGTLGLGNRSTAIKVCTPPTSYSSYLFVPLT